MFETNKPLHRKMEKYDMKPNTKVYNRSSTGPLFSSPQEGLPNPEALGDPGNKANYRCKLCMYSMYHKNNCHLCPELFVYTANLVLL